MVRRSRVRTGVARAHNAGRMLRRRDLLKLIGLGAATGMGAACSPAPPGGATPVPATPTTAPTPRPTAGLATPGPLTNPLSGLFPARQTLTPLSATFRVAISADPDTLEPVGQTAGMAQAVVDAVVEPLVFLQPNGKVAPGLAESWEVSPDGKAYTFSLRGGVRFHDGSPLDAAAVQGSLARVLNPQMKVPVRAPFDQALVESIAPRDARTLRIRLRTPFAPLLLKLAGTEMAIVSPAHAASFPDSWNEAPVGTGPFRFGERRKGESVLLERFDGYWGRRPLFQSVQFRVVPEAATRESLLLAEQVELIVSPPLSDIPALQRNPTVKVLLTPSHRTAAVAMDLTLPGGTPLAIKKVRQALNYGVDKESIIRTVLFGAATVMDAPMAPMLFGYTRAGPYGFDPSRAKRLLLEAGTPGLNLRFLHPAGPPVQDAQIAQATAQAIAGSLRDVGVATELTTADFATYLATVNVPEDRGSFHMHLLTWTPGFLDASQQMLQFSKAQWPPRGLATSHYSNPRVEELLEAALPETDPQRRQELYAEAQRIVWDDAPWIFLWAQQFPVVHTTRVRGVVGLPTEKLSVAAAEPAF